MENKLGNRKVNKGNGFYNSVTGFLKVSGCEKVNEKMTFYNNTHNNIINSKRADTHLEMIISFSMFLLFVIFLLTYMNPVKQPDISASLLRTAEIGIEKYSTTLLNVPVVLGIEQSDCFKIESPFEATMESQIFVEDTDGTFADFNADASGITIKGTGKKLYYLYLVKQGSFAHHADPVCDPLLEPLDSLLYDFSIPRLKTVYLKSELDKLKSKYDGSYDLLKEEFNYPKTSDFAVFIRNADTNQEIFSMSVTKPEKVVVNAKELPIMILEEKADGTKKEIEANINMQVW